MGIVSRFGAWLDRKFPDKVNAADVLSEFLTLRAAVNQLSEGQDNFAKRISELENKGVSQEQLTDLKDDINKIKAIMQLKQKQSVEMPNLTGATAWRR